MEITIVFTDTKTALSKMIKAYTGHPYSHVSLSFDRELTEMYSFGRKDVKNAFIGGFVKEDPEIEFFQKANCAVYRCSVSALQYFEMRDYVRNMEKRREHLKYNLSGLFGILLKRENERKDAYFCSQFVSEVLMAGGIKVADKPPYLVMPRDIFMLPELEYVHSGTFSDYPFLEKGIYASSSEVCLTEVF